MTTYRVEETKCPHCQYKLDAASHLDTDGRGMPEENDLTICGNCGTILMFNDDTSLRLPSEEDLKDVPYDVMDQLTQIHRIIQQARYLTNRG